MVSLMFILDDVADLMLLLETGVYISALPVTLLTKLEKSNPKFYIL